MLTADYDYPLPDELIARYPLAKRRDSRLLVVDPAGDTIDDRHFAELPDLLEPGDLLVFNDTRVIRARLRGRKATGGRAEVLLERCTGGATALAQVRASKSPPVGSELLLPGGCRATVTGRARDLYELEFDRALDAYLERHGEVPLPPYLGRPAESADTERYQTVYAREPGAVAAPTAGLHFDEGLLAETRRRGVGHAWLTLHVGAGTFQPLRETDVEANRLHSERIEVGREAAEAVNATRAAGGRVIAVGTTSVRALESAARDDGVAPTRGETELFITPGYRFRTVDALITNFHLPKSSLLMLVAALAGRERILAAYRHAVRERYRFYSYGDAMLILPGGTDGAA